MLSHFIVALYALLPITMLTSHSLPSGIFYALIAASLALLVQKRFAGAREQTYRYRWLIASYSVLFLSVAASSIYYGKWAGTNSEGALRFFLGLLLPLLALPYIDSRRLTNVVWGVFAACLVSISVLLWLSVTTDTVTPVRIVTTYASIMLLLGAITAYSLKWQLTTWPTCEKILKIFLTLAAFSGFLVAQTRTPLLGLPVLVFLGLALFIGVKRPVRLIAGLVAAAAVLVVTVGSNDALRGRIAEGIQEVKACQGDGSTDYSSMCIRLQMWRAAVDAGSANPWVGLGDAGKFHDYMRDVAVPMGVVAPYVVEEGFGEPHNDLLLMFVGFGFPGALALLLMYLVPCAYFLPRLFGGRSTAQTRAAAAMGLAVCLSFLCFGLTETMFRRMNTMGFYSAFIALFMVLSEPRRSVVGPSARVRQVKPIRSQS